MSTFDFWSIKIDCSRKNRRGGFKHIAILSRNWLEIAEEKVLRVNRTWERFTFETVIKKLINFSHENWFITNKEYESVLQKLN